ncbi:CoA pyrophosphatase [Cereibacter changlensis JA139]|uniref:CoA pyrophosphatase n=2 Tax=Cereibacter changlensis TaxID=402884 RepID=A0A2T4K0X1_9RHOB|nr:CoA pyrophosphatase [Cereibacter changlensis]PTE23776.1 CoA pyrophosphatase [Cereibacter changlensis JA139]PZX59014.1 8-oxo-dGTP pyrophosphatase MutT (NUDIX family) [Cereibacter changlensis]
MGPDALRLALTRATDASSDYDLNPGISLPEGRKLRAAAVLIPVWERPGGAQLILTKRASHLAHHPGQIAFPGGKIDAGDASPEAAALREAEEEVGLDPARVEILGQLPPHETVTGYTVVPVLALVQGELDFRCDPREVEEVFTVPLAHVLTPARYRIERRLWRGEWRRYYTVPWGPYYIWGATARMLRGLADRMAT